LERGTVGGGKREWEGKGRERGGGCQFTSNLGPEWTGVAPHAKEGFQVSKGDSGTGEGSPDKGGIIKGNYQGDLSKGLCHVLSYIILYIYRAIVCMWLIKNCV
jgi:hypothetical protein